MTSYSSWGWPYGTTTVPSRINTTTTFTPTSTTTTRQPVSTTYAPTNSSNNSTVLNTVGIAAAALACAIFLCVVAGVVVCLRKAHVERSQQRQRRTSQTTTATATSTAEAPPTRQRKRVYTGVPIYPTTQVADGDEVVFVPALEDIPEATAAPMPRVRTRTAAGTDDRAHPPATTTPSMADSSGVDSERRAAMPPAYSVLNPLQPSTVTHSLNAEACVGVVVPDLDEAERSQAERRWYRQRDYGSALYYSHAPRAPQSQLMEMSDVE